MFNFSTEDIPKFCDAHRLSLEGMREMVAAGKAYVEKSNPKVQANEPVTVKEKGTKTVKWKGNVG